ncbi:MAG: cytochrome c biogenesis protein [Nitrospira sp.]|nr:cytochrome c biogenesis protein [Nitrospira sp.]
MDILFFKITLGFYFLGTILFLWYLVSKKESWGRFSIIATVAGFLTHTLALIIHVMKTGQISVMTVHESIGFFSWALVLIFLVVEYQYRLQVLGSLIVPLAFLSVLSAATLRTQMKPLDPNVQGLWLGIHITLTLLGIVFFTLAFVVGIIYLVQEWLLKSKRLNVLYHKLPSLDLLDDLNQRFIYLGFPFLTLGIITGIILNKFVQDVYFTWEPKQIFTLVTWFFYLAMLHGRLTIGWRAKKAAYLAVIGFVGVVFTFVGVSHF